jgi:uncharacterized Zn-finger protein
MFTCNVCLKIFKRKDNLMVHIKSVHEGRKFSCEICKKSYTRKYVLDKHKEAHTVLQLTDEDMLNDSWGNTPFLNLNMDFVNPGKIILNIKRVNL